MHDKKHSVRRRRRSQTRPRGLNSAKRNSSRFTKRALVGKALQAQHRESECNKIREASRVGRVLTRFLKHPARIDGEPPFALCLWEGRRRQVPRRPEYSG